VTVGGGTGPATGIWLFPDAPAAELVDALVAAEALGVDEVWLGDEGPGRDPFGVLAAAAVRTTRLRLALGVTNPYLRHPAITAASMATVHELSGGRAVLGLGPGGRLALAPLGITPQRPLHDCRRALEVIRGVCRAEPVDGYQPPAHALRAPDLPVFVGARGERFNRWASAEADGAFLAGIAPSLVGDVVAWAHSVRPIPLAIYASVCLDGSVDEVRPRLIHAFADAPPRLRQQAGLNEVAVSAAAAALAEGDEEPAARLLPDEVLALVLGVGADEAVTRCVALARAHRPASVGLALLGNDPLGQVERASFVLARVRKELA